MPRLATVYHGIDFTEFSPRASAVGYLAYLGRISPEKGLDTAIRVAKRAGLPLKVGARPPLPYHNDPNVQADRTYYERGVEPLLGQPVLSSWVNWTVRGETRCWAELPRCSFR
jgi:glycosyltransferase involved in cell wall biosynthesis